VSARVLSWDWRGQPDLNQLAAAIRDLSEGRVSVQQVDTGSDEYAIVLSDEPLTASQATTLWEGGQ
jgi:hypothetical protein